MLKGHLRRLSFLAKATLWRPQLKNPFVRMASVSLTSNSAVRLEANPRSALVDEALKLQVLGLQPRQSVTVTAEVTETSCYLSHAHYTANDNGEIDLQFHSSSGGSYTGVEPMGLFWSMLPSTKERLGSRLMKKDVTTPLEVQLSVLKDFVKVTTAEDIKQCPVLTQSSVERWYMGPEVQRIVVKDGRLRGTLFLPKGNGPFPGVIDLFGTAGGLNEFRAALLASRGIAAFSLAYFGYDDLPQGLQFDLEYFEEAIEWLHNHPKILKSGLGTVGVSKGGELVLFMAISSSKVRATVAINSYYYYSSAIHVYRGEELPTVFPQMSQIDFTEEAINCKRAYSEAEASEECIIPVEKIPTPVLLIHAEDDQMCAADVHGERLAARMKEHGKTNYKLLVYPGAGHLIEPPHAPSCRITFHKLTGGIIDYGGEPKLHARAQEASWSEILTFLKTNLLPPEDGSPTSKL